MVYNACELAAHLCLRINPLRPVTYAKSGSDNGLSSVRSQVII